jgi:hypothetical protein
VISENVFGKTYSNATAQAIDAKIHKGADLPYKQKFKSTNQREYSPQNFRRYRKLTYFAILI